MYIKIQKRFYYLQAGCAPTLSGLIPSGLRQAKTKTSESTIKQ